MPKKNDEIWAVERTASMSRRVRRLIVKSWGPKQGELIGIPPVLDHLAGKGVRKGCTAEAAVELAKLDIEDERSRRKVQIQLPMYEGNDRSTVSCRNSIQADIDNPGTVQLVA